MSPPATWPVALTSAGSDSSGGAGCTLSAAITARLAAGERLVDGVGAARDYLQQCLENARVLGRGHGPLHHFHAYWEAP